MKAAVGDRIVVQVDQDGASRRIGIITEVRHPDGTPPYMVRWLDERESLFFPSISARIEPHEEHVANDAAL